MIRAQQHVVLRPTILPSHPQTLGHQQVEHPAPRNYRVLNFANKTRKKLKNLAYHRHRHLPLPMNMNVMIPVLDLLIPLLPNLRLIMVILMANPKPATTPLDATANTKQPSLKNITTPFPLRKTFPRLTLIQNGHTIYRSLWKTFSTASAYATVSNAVI